MGILDCFRKDKKAINDLKEVFVESIIRLATNNTDIDFRSVYKEIVDNRDIEIDIESASQLYDEVRTDKRIQELSEDVDSFMTTPGELQSMREGEIQRQIDKFGVVVDKKKRTIKYDKFEPARAVAIALLNTFSGKFKAAIGSKAAESESFAIKKAISDYAKSFLGTRTVGKQVDLLEDALKKDMMRSDFAGSTDDLFDKLKPALDDIAARIKSPALRAEFENEIAKIKEAAFNMGITESKRKKILYDVLRESEYGKTTKSGKRILDMHKLARVEDLEAVFKEVLSDKLDSKEINYKGDKSRVYNALIQEINELRKSHAYANAIKANKRSDEAKAFNDQLGKEVAIANGFYDLADGRKIANFKPKEGEKKREREKVKEMLKDIGYDEAVAKLMSEQPDLTAAFSQISENYQSIKSNESVREAVRRIMVLNNKPFSLKVNEMDRLVKLQQKGIGMDNTTDALSASILGIKIRASHIQEMNDIVKRYAAIMKSPEKLYQEIIDEYPEYNFKFNNVGNIPPGLWASRTLERLNRDMSRIIIESVGDDSRLIQGMYLYEHLQRTYLSALLTNITNLPQNAFTAINTLISSGKSVLGEKKMKTMWGLFLLDAAGSPTDPTQMHSEFKDWSEAETLRQRVGALYRTITQGALNAIDGVAHYYGMRRRFYNGIIEAMHLKGYSDDQIDKIMEPFFNEDAMKKSYAMARKFFKEANITPQKIEKARFKRELDAEAQTIQMQLLMGDPVLTGMGLTEEHILARKESAQRLTNFALGKELPYVTKGKGSSRGRDYKNNIPLFVNAIAQAGREQGAKLNRAIKEYAEDPTKKKMWVMLFHWTVKGVLHGGPLKFGAGIAKFGDMAFGTLFRVGGFGFDFHNRKKRYEEIIKNKNKEGPANVDDTIELLEELEIYRHKNYLFHSAVATSLLILLGSLAIVGRDDDDDTNWFEESVDAMMKLSDSNPAFKKLFTRIGALHIRMLHAWEVAGKSKDKSKAYYKLLGTIFNTGPTSSNDLIDKMYDFKDGEFTGELGKTISTVIIPSPAAALSDIVVGPINFVKDMIRGRSLPYNVDESLLATQYLPNKLLDSKIAQNRVVNGMWIGLHGQQINYYKQGNTGINKDIMENDKIRKPEEYNKLKGLKFSDINWADYGSPKLNDGRFNVDLAYDRITDIEQKISEVVDDLGIDISPKQLENMYRRPYNSMFSVPTKGLDFSKLQGYDYSTKEDAAAINIAGFALKSMGLKGINIKDVETAIKYRNFQESLK